MDPRKVSLVSSKVNVSGFEGGKEEKRILLQENPYEYRTRIILHEEEVSVKKALAKKQEFKN